MPDIEREEIIFYNPVKQNNSHIKNLNKILKQDKSKLKSLIVFNRSRLRKVSIGSENVFVITSDQLKRFLNRCRSQADVYTEQEVNDMYERLIPYTKGIRRNEAETCRADSKYI